MDWLFPLLTFALGLCLSTALFLGLQVRRLRRHESQPAAQSDDAEGTVPNDSEATTEIVTRTKAAATQAHGSHRTATQVGFENPRLAFRRAYLTGDTERATALLHELGELLGHESTEFLLSAGALAIAGKRQALPYLLEAVRSENEMDDELRQSTITSIVQFYVSTDLEKEGLEEMEKTILDDAHDKSKSAAYRAYFANQLQMLYYGSKRSDDALQTVRYAIGLSPESASYYFNESLILEQQGNLDDAVQAIERCVELGEDDDEDHLRQALDLYKKVGDRKKIEPTEEKLEKLMSP